MARTGVFVRFRLASRLASAAVSISSNFTLARRDPRLAAFVRDHQRSADRAVFIEGHIGDDVRGGGCLARARASASLGSVPATVRAPEGDAEESSCGARLTRSRRDDLAFWPARGEPAARDPRQMLAYDGSSRRSARLPERNSRTGFLLLLSARTIRPSERRGPVRRPPPSEHHRRSSASCMGGKPPTYLPRSSRLHRAQDDRLDHLDPRVGHPMAVTGVVQSPVSCPDRVLRLVGQYRRHRVIAAAPLPAATRQMVLPAGIGAVLRQHDSGISAAAEPGV